MSGKIIKSVNKSHTSEEVAKCLIKIADESELPVQDPETNQSIKDGVTNLKLQKMMFFAQAAHLALFGKPLFEEDFQAWPLGPVLPNIYHKYKEHIKDSIPVPTEESCNDKELTEFLKAIWGIFGKYTASELVNLSHREGSPWYNHFKKDGNNETIPKEEIKDYYKQFFQLNSDE